MINFLKGKTFFIRILAMIVLVLPLIIPVSSWVLAQNDMRYFSSAHAVDTSDFGIESPEGMTYFSDTDSFVVWGSDKSENVIRLGEESSRYTNLAKHISNPLGASFDNYSNSLFVLGAENLEMLKMNAKGRTSSALFDKSTSFNIASLELQDVQGMTSDPNTGRIFILDASKWQILAVSPNPLDGFDMINVASHRISRVDLESLSQSRLRGVAFNPTNDHLYVGSPDERKVYEVTETGEWISTYDVSSLDLENPSAMLFAPSQDSTDDSSIMDLYILDRGQSSESQSSLLTEQMSISQQGQIVELSLQAPAALPPGTPLLSTTLEHVIDTSKAAWNPSSPDPAGVDYWPLTGRLLISDSEVEEMRNYYQGKNVFQSTTSGTLVNTCDTTSFTNEPTGVAINPNNNHIFFSSDADDSIFEVGLGPDGIYCTADDTVTATNVGILYGIGDAEDVAYGNNTLFIAGGVDKEVYKIPLGQNGILGGGDDGAMTHFDTAVLGFRDDLEGLGYKADSGTLLIITPAENFVGETTTTGTLVRAYSINYSGFIHREDITYAPGSQNPSIKNFYIAARGVDNNANSQENDGKVWEISFSNPSTPIPSTPTSTPVISIGANVDVNIGNSEVGNYNITEEGIISADYGINGGPVHVESTDGVTPIFTSERAIFGASFNSIVGYPGDQLTTEYWFTSYDDVGMITFLVIGNPHPTDTAVVDVYIGGVKRNTTPYSIAPGQRIFPRYGINAGPVRVVSTNGVDIFTSERTKFGNSFNEVMGYPANQLTTDYWFTSYDDAGMITYLVIGNPSTSQTAQVDVYIGGVKRNATSYQIAPGQRLFPRYGINGGPVRVVSTNGVDIFTSERTKFGSTFNEVMGYPGDQVSTEFWFTSYDDVGMTTFLIIGNPHPSNTALVDVYIGGVKRNTTPYSIAPGQRMFQRYGINGGPVRVVSTNGVDVFASERSKYLNSFNEILGIADNQLATDYWFTSYDDMGMTTFLVIGTP